MRRALLVLCLVASPAAGQYQQGPRTSNAALIGVNALVGGATAAVHAWIRHDDVARAFALGTLGGTVHLGGKLLVTRVRDATWLGIATSAVGTSIVANAGAGRPVLDEVALPIGFLRLNVHPSRARKASLSLNLFDAGTLAVLATRSDLTFDPKRSLRTGAFAFSSGRRWLRSGADTVSGVAPGSAIVLSDLYRDQEGLLRHEMIHVHQYWFMQGAAGVPIERALRRRLPLVKRLPSWIELGIIGPALRALDAGLLGERGLHGLRENEADILEIR